MNPEEPRLAGRNGKIWRAYCRGKTQAALAEEFGISQQRVSQIVSDVRDAIPMQEREAILKQEIDLLSDLRSAVLDLWDQDAPNLVSNGRVIEGVKDHSGRLAALARAESLTARLHKITGIEAAQKVDLSMQGEEEAARRAAADALAHLHGGTDA
jgi:transcriptional regulator with XRE-family HTH domain